MPMNPIKSEVVSIKDTGHDEKWLQNYIADNSSVLGLGELRVEGKERVQPSGGRLDLLLEDESKETRYAVEVQLGSPDESHIVRAVEYWDLEKKRFPEYDCIAVLIAEKVIASRYFNVVSLLADKLPLIVFEVSALQMNNKNDFTLAFTKVLEDPNRGFKDKVSTPADRSYWEQGSTAETIKWVDDLFEIINEFAPEAKLNYLNSYIGLQLNGVSRNFVTFNPKSNAVTVHVKIPKGEEVQDWDQKIDDSGIKRIKYDSNYKNYRLVLESQEEISSKREFLLEIMKYAYGLLG